MGYENSIIYLIYENLEEVNILKKFKKIISLLLVVVMLISADMTSFASNKNTKDVDACLENNLKQIEQDMENQGTSVSAELDAALQNLRSEMQSCATYAEHDKLQALIETTIELKESYDRYSSGTAMPQGITHPVLTPAIAAVASYFSVNGYLLSFELLVHAEDNNVLNSNYIPYYGSKINASPFIPQVKSGGKDATGSGSFENQGTKEQKDLYYAIHAFNYSYVRNTGKFTLTDRYDFAYGDYNGIAGAAIDTMWMAQNLGVLVPYYLKIVV